MALPGLPSRGLGIHRGSSWHGGTSVPAVGIVAGTAIRAGWPGILALSPATGSYTADISGGGQTVRMWVVEYDVKVEDQDVPKMFCLVTDLDDVDAYPCFAVETSFLPADPVCLAVSLSASGHRTSEASRSFSSTQISRALLSSCPFSTPCLAQVGSE